MKRITLLLIVAMLSTGCSRYGKKLLGIEEDKPEPPQARLVYERGGSIVGNWFLYGDPKFKYGDYVVVDVCQEDWTGCQSLPQRSTVEKGDASYLWGSGAVWLYNVPKNIDGARKWNVKVYKY